MPQLDFLIILPQIFWLIICFSLFYFFLTYYFLPRFLKTIKARINFIKNNQILEIQVFNAITEKQKKTFKNLNKTLSNIRSLLFIKLFTLKFNFTNQPFKNNYLILNKKILIASTHSLFFCNSILLNSLEFYPLFLNKKKLNK
uniref:ATP synthase F0 subunit 8 n=1 Tax=Symphyocladiella dendroidea TaxID=2506487 RepID=UPI0022FD783B|nr:ATP synthase F0 subunit 8 [Symphyocladiella dendroidea]WAX04036.1 ATP synthase F0 subunit 8 [Symphyocladiella dendroidea]